MSKLPLLFLTLLAVVCFAPVALMQTAQTPAQATPSPAQDDVVRVSTELVQTDVIVVDKQGRFVDGLDRDKFELRVNGKEQPIAFFDRVIAGSNKEAAILTSSRKPSDKTEPATSSETPALERGRTTFLFVDDMHLSPSSIVRTRDLLTSYVDNVMGPKDEALIATATGQLGFLQQLTGDRNVLRMAIKRLTHRPFSADDKLSNPPMTEYQAVAIENGDRDVLSYFVDQQCDEFKQQGRGACVADTGLTNNAVYDDAVARPGRGSTNTSGTSPGPVPTDPNQPARGTRATSGANTVRATAEREVKSRAHVIAGQAAVVTRNTLNALEALIRASSPIRERKLVVFISDGFFLNYLRANNVFDLRRIADAALRSGTVIYTIDARGLSTGSPDASMKGGFDKQGRVARMAMAEVSAAQDPLNALAVDTGGKPFFNSNNLQQGLSQALQETSAYYLLAWRPETSEVAKDPFRKVEIKIKDRSDLVVRARTGFFADDPSVSSANTASGMSVDDQLMGVIRETFPRAAIPLVVSLGYLDRPEDGPTLAASIQVEREHGAAADAELDVMGALIDEGGNILSSLKQKVTIPADKSANAHTMLLTLQFPKLTPGLRQVRIAARDSRTGRIGSTTQWIEVPNLKEGLSLSSIFLSEGGSAQKVAIKPDAHFSKNSKLRFQTHVYNAGSSPNVVMQVELSRNGQVLSQTPPSAVSLAGVKDLARIPVVGEFPLQIFPEGQYALKIIVTDQATKKTASQQATFVVQ